MTESYDSLSSLEGTEVAIIGMAGRFPGANDIDEFWSNLTHGIESISFFRDDEINTTGLDPAILEDPHYVKAAGVLEGAENFDAEFFGFYPREAEILDPQQRVFLECAWEALENAGYDPETYKGWIGVYAGSGMSTYLIYHLIANREILESVHGFQLTISTDKDFLPTRVSYKLNLRGPSVNIQTACSTSLVATHMACQSLINYQCDMALAGGVSIRLPLKQGYLYQEGGINSPDGHCRAFDEDAQGTVSGSGAGVIVLKRLADALAERDHIYAVIKGTAINNDGSMKVGYTAPSIEGQAEVIAMAQAVANIDPETISYIEAHGTGTSLGDPIEISALTQVFRTTTERKQFCAIGSLKTNVGHLDAAAGVTGVIKTALALRQKLIPPSINFSKPNPKIDFENSPFFVNTELRDWVTDNFPRRAGVSSFGIGGTNAHAILEEANIEDEYRPSRSCQMLMISARSEEALEQASSRLGNYLASSEGNRLSDAAHTLQVGRKEFPFRKVVLARSAQDAVKILTKKSFENVFISKHSNGKTQVVFMFTGQGSQYVQMAKGLYDTEATFRKHFDHCADVLLPFINIDLRRVVYPEISSFDDAAKEAANEILQQTNLAQPAIFSVEYAMAQLLMSWGIQPQVAIGHSIGEYVAATLAGVFSLEDALNTVAARGKLMQSLPKGSMVSVSLSESEIHDYLDDNISLAAVNGPNLCVLSGNDPAIETLVSRFQRDGIEFRKLKTSHAFHSNMMDPILETFKGLVANLDLHPPQLRFVSNLTGTWISSEQAMSPQYWTDHLRNTVRFASGIDELMKDPSVVFIETGPGRALSVFVKNHPGANLGRTILTTIRHPQDHQEDDIFLFASIAKLWLNGVKIDWEGFYSDEVRKRIPLPTYPFERKRYWIEPDTGILGSIGERKLLKRKKIQDWFYYPTWKKIPLLQGQSEPVVEGPTRWLLFLPAEQENFKLGESIYQKAYQRPENVLVVRPGKAFQEIDRNNIEINPKDQSDYDLLIKKMADLNWLPDQIVHAWSSCDNNNPSNYDNTDQILELGFYSLLFLTQAIMRQWGHSLINITIISSGIFQVTGHETIIPEKATLVGLCLVIPQEDQNIHCKLVDVESHFTGTHDIENQTNFLLRQIAVNSGEKLIALRNNSRWIQVYEPLSNWPSVGKNPRLKNEGVYLITGGLGRIGLVYANYLSKTCRAKIILVDRLAFPERDNWDGWLNSHDAKDSTSLRINSIKDIEAQGGSVDVVFGNVSEQADVFGAFDYVIKKYGAIHGIIHSAGFVSADSIIPVQELKRSDCEAHFAPKISGLRNISNVINEREDLRENLEFVLLQSSLSTILGGLGLSAYAAANQFMDSFINNGVFNHQIPWISINWDGWNFKDSQTRNISRGIQKQAGSGIIELSLTPEEGTKVFELLLGQSELNQVIVSTGNLEDRLRQWITHEEQDSSVDDRGKSSSRHSRPNLQTPYVEPTNDIEKNLTLIWEKVLGIAPIGVYDDFFELGGHSLLATQLMTRLRDQFAVELPLRRLFETPTIHGICDLIRTAQPDKVDTAITPILRIPRDAELRLSFGQQRLWFLDQFEPGSTLYNNFTAIRLTGSLNIEALQKSLISIVERHEVLRTVFEEKKGQPVQVILPILDNPLKVIDLTDNLEKEVHDAIKNIALEEVKQPFNLKTGPLLRLVLIRLSPNETILFLIAHHIVSDGWSVSVMVQELATLYSSFNRNEAIQLPELKIQYADYAAWQRQWLAGEVLESQEKYWLNQLKNLPTSIDLMTDYARPAVQTSNGANLWFEIPEQLSQSLQNLSQKEGTTLFMVLMAALNTLLYRYTGQEDLVVGTPVANRNRIEIEPLIGFILNILVIRSDVSGDPTFRELIKRVKDVSLSAFANQDYPFEMLVDKLQPERDMSRSPLFQVIFDLQDATQQTLELPDLTIAPVKIDIGTTKYDLAFSMEDHGTHLNGYINYNTDLFRSDTIQRLLEHFIRILKAIVALPDLKVSSIPLLTEEESNEIIYGWNKGHVDLDIYQSIGSLIEKTVIKDPMAIAVMDSSRSITFGQLSQISTQIAYQLSLRQSARGEVYGLFMDRSIEAIAGMLGIMNAGCVYLPLDPGAPDERLKFMLNDANAKGIITEGSLLQKMSQILPDSIDRGKIFLYENLVNLTSTYSEGNTNNLRMAPYELAYIIYTSGSTGQPKGVMISHQALSNHCRVIKDHFQITSSDRVLQFSAYSFDQSIEQILVTIIAGATLFVRGPEIWTPEEFIRVIDEQQLSVVNIQPAYWLQWSQAAVKKTDPIAQSLKLTIIGGDAILPEHVHLWAKTPMKDSRLLNAYGPTEATITASTYEISTNGNDHLDVFRVPIGKPLPNRWFYVLDKNHKPVPIGVPGELFISGDCLAEGYVNQPEMTADRFIENPFVKHDLKSKQPGKRMYRTGDLARYLPSGDVEFLGRVDTQVKVRGFRIELGEIETILESYPLIREAVVLAKEAKSSPYLENEGGRTPADKRLVAYLTVDAAEEKEKFALNDLRDFLRSKLPGYMIPSAFLFLDTIPQTLSGKVDRRALALLPVSDETQSGTKVAYLAPRTPVEVELAMIWSEVLGVKKVGVFDNFFELGGHSLLATQVISRIREIYHVDLPLRKIFESPTIDTISMVIAQDMVDHIQTSEADEEIKNILAELNALSNDEILKLLDDNQ